MKRFLLSLLVLFGLAVNAGAATTLTGDIITKGPWVDVRAFTNLSTAVASPVTAGKMILVPNAQTVNNKTIPADREVAVIRGGSITVNAGKTLTFAAGSGFHSGLGQAFYGAGTVAFGIGSVSEVPVEWFGSVGNGSTDDSGAIKAAIAATPAGATVSLSHASTSYKYDNSGGLTSAAVINKAITLRIDSTVVGTTGGIAPVTNPPYIFKITADDVVVTGKGIVQFSGTPDDTNAGDQTTTPGLIYVSGSRCKITGLTFTNAPKTAIMFYNNYDCEASSCKFTGGAASYTTGHTALHGAYLYVGGRHKFANNYFGPDADGKKLVTGIFGNGSNGNVITGNVVNSLYEKLHYLYGDYNVISNNYVTGVTQTAPYRVQGSYNKIIGNTAKDCLAGAQVSDGVGNSIIGNSFIGCTQTGIAVQDISVGISNTKIANNHVTGTDLTAAQDGIVVYADALDASNISITGNTVTGFKHAAGTNYQSAIKIQAVSPYNIYNSIISGNTETDGYMAVSLIRGVGCKVSGNTLNYSAYGVYIKDGNQNLVSDNVSANITAYALGVFGTTTNTSFLNNRSHSPTSIGIYGITATPANGNYGRGNQYTDAAMTGQVTLSAAASVTVTHGGVAANAIISIIPANAAAATSQATKGMLTGLTGNNFLINTGDGTSFGGTELLNWSVSQ